jgi:hypothetical protein
MMGTGSPMKPLSFSQQSPFEPSQLGFDNPKSSPSVSFMQSTAAPQRSGLNSQYQASPQRSFQAPQQDSEEEEDGAEYLDEEEEDDRYHYQNEREHGGEDADAMSDEDGQYDEDENMDDYQSENQASRSRPNDHGYDQRSTSDLLPAAPGGLRRSREGELLDFEESMARPFSGQPDTSVYGEIAKDLCNQLGVPAIEESDDLVLNTEAIITRLYEEGIGTTHNDDLLQQALTNIPRELIQLWATYQRNTAIYDSEEYAAAIGPGPRASNFAKANFLAGVTLQIHHPQTSDPNSFEYKVKPLPQIMLEWLDEYHDPYPSQFEEILAHRPSPANHRLFWDNIFNGLLRGKVLAVVNIMKNAGWRYARDGMDDIRNPSGQVGFTGVALANVEKVIGAATQVLSQCPAVHGDWNIRSSDWTLFRLRVSQALEDLKRFAEGRDRGRDESSFEPEGFGMASTASGLGSYSRTAKKAESQVPWHIYQNVLTLYNLAMGDSNAIVENAQDWCEATVGLLVWWDEGKEDRRLALARSQVSHRSAARDSDSDAYLRKLQRSFESATAESTDFQVNTLDPVEVGLASLLEGDNEAVIGFLRAWSGPVSSAVAEVASLAEWLPHAEPQSLINMGSLDQEDMDLLGINSSPSKADGAKDQTLIAYAKSLAQRGQLKSAARLDKPAIIREGWELAIAVLGRLDSAARSEEMVSNFLSGFLLDSSTTVDKLWRLLDDLGMTRQAESSAEVR